MGKNLTGKKSLDTLAQNPAVKEICKDSDGYEMVLNDGFTFEGSRYFFEDTIAQLKESFKRVTEVVEIPAINKEIEAPEAPEDTSVKSLLTEILEDYANGYTYFEYPLQYGIYGGEFILQGECLVVHLEALNGEYNDDTESRIGLLIESTDIVNFTNGTIDNIETWLNSQIYYNMQ